MLIVTIVTLLCASMLWDVNLTIRRSGNMLASDQALQYALGAESWARDILRTDGQETDVDHRNEVWASALPALPIEGGVIEGRLVDLHSRFNINNLIGADGEPNEAVLEQFQRLLDALGLDRRVAMAAADWVDAGPDPVLEGAEDDFYTERDPPYRPPNVALTSATEMLAVKDMGIEAWRVLRPHVTALPGGTPVNVNTATPAVLQAIGDVVDANEARAIFEQAGTTPFEGVEELGGRLGEGAGSADVRSDFFQLEVRVTLGATLFTMYSLLERDRSANVWTRFRSFYTE
jgi:general secretion pathway protein K